jgi:hypothetical protein
VVRLLTEVIRAKVANSTSVPIRPRFGSEFPTLRFRGNNLGTIRIPLCALLWFSVPVSVRKSLKFQVKVLCHGRGCEFESRRPRHSFQGVTGRDTENSNPQLNPQLLIHCCAHLHSVQEFALHGSSFVAVVLRIESERDLNLAMTLDSLNGFWFVFRFVHQPVA